MFSENKRRMIDKINWMLGQDQEINEINELLKEQGELDWRGEQLWQNKIHNYYNKMPQTQEREHRRSWALNLLETHNDRLREKEDDDSIQAVENNETYLAQALPLEPVGIGTLTPIITQFGIGISDFLRNHHDMKEENTLRNDKYFHCKANCEATKRGFWGEKTAEIISEGREITDSVRNQLPKNLKGKQLSKQNSDEDIREDQEANHIGRKLGKMSNSDCGKKCYGKFPYNRASRK